jgi:hypothetical protein
MQQEFEQYIAHAIGAKPRGFIYAPTSDRWKPKRFSFVC